VIYSDLGSMDRLPLGMLDEQSGGKYRLHHDDSAGYFDHVAGPHSLKNFLFPPRETLLSAKKDSDGHWQMTPPAPPNEPVAVIGMRACDLHGVRVLDKTLLDGPYVDEAYRARREALFLVAVHCRRAADTCFCHAMQTGPAVKEGYDLALSEFDDHFVVEIGTDKGAELLSAVAWSECTSDESGAAGRQSQELEAAMHRESEAGRRRSLDTGTVHELLMNNLEHARWEEVGQRCLACANCTMVCPTCFCVSVDEVSDLTGESVQRERVWDSCFTAQHSYMTSGSVRKSIASRYRQWLTHKLATWQDQFDTLGCVGCGRCITWCPVGIDLTEEVAAIKGGES